MEKGKLIIEVNFKDTDGKNVILDLLMMMGFTE